MDTRPAIEGGKPVREEFLHFHRPQVGEEEEREILDTLRSGWLTTAGKTKEFERLFAEYCGCEHAVALNSCTAGLHLSLVASGIGPGDEVITTPMTFAATANVIVHVGATPVFVDVDPRTLNIDASKIEERVTSRTKAIIPVHFLGQACDMDAISEIAGRHNLLVIEDAAHAVETVYKGRKIGTISPLTVFSFYSTKNMTTGEGGMLTTDDDQLEEKIRVLSLHGISRDAWKRFTEKGYAHWDIIYPGYKYNMSDIQASIGLHQIARLPALWEKRREIVGCYNQAFEGVPELSLLRQDAEDGCVNGYHMYVLILKNELLKEDRDYLMNAVEAENIAIGIHYRAVHTHPYYKETLKYEPGSLPEAEYASERVLSVPLFPTMTERDVQDVIDGVKKIITWYRS